MKRYTITLGAKTTAGGQVIDATSRGSINSVPIALEGDPIFCQACGVAGRILCVGPRLRERWNGKNVALEGDLCVCRCITPPRLIANQNMRCQVIGSAEIAAHEQALAAQVGAAPVPEPTGSLESFDLSFQLMDELSGLPVAETAYTIELANGTRVEGLTDRDGMTEKIVAATAERATLRVFDPEPASIDPLWDR